jgi:hypothetical protein
MRDIEFDESTYYTGPDLTDALIASAELRLGYRLPSSYIELLRVRNGGIPRRRRFRTDFATSWAPDNFEISAFRGVGGPWGIDSDGPLSSREMIAEWGYPDIGIVICDMPSGGHDAVMLDYREGPRDPKVAYVDEDRVPHVVARSFTEFVEHLEDADVGLGRD